MKLLVQNETCEVWKKRCLEKLETHTKSTNQFSLAIRKQDLGNETCCPEKTTRDVNLKLAGHVNDKFLEKFEVPEILKLGKREKRRDGNLTLAEDVNKVLGKLSS